MDGFNLEARWVKFSERVPTAGKIVLARKIGGKNVGSIRVEDDECCTYPVWVFNCVFSMLIDELQGCEWLELRQKVQCSEPAVPLPDGRMLEVNEFHDLAEMFRLQDELNKRIGADMIDIAAVGDKQAIVQWTKRLVTAMQQELAELVDCVPWKWWANYQDYDRQNARVEIVDLFHFLISMSQLHGMTAQDVFEAYKAKCEINHKRQDSGYRQKDPDDCMGI